jgi:hypothetical protein
MTWISANSAEFRKCLEIEDNRGTADIDEAILNVIGAANR